MTPNYLTCNKNKDSLKLSLRKIKTKQNMTHNFKVDKSHTKMLKNQKRKSKMRLSRQRNAYKKERNQGGKISRDFLKSCSRVTTWPSES